MGVSMSLLSVMRLFLYSGSRTGMADSSACVYGYRGLSNSWPVTAYSMIFPRCMTTTRLTRYLTTIRLCEMNRHANEFALQVP